MGPSLRYKMERVPQHSHCQICGKAVPFEKVICSDECEEQYGKIVKKRKFYMYIMYGAMAILIFMFILMYV